MTTAKDVIVSVLQPGIIGETPGAAKVVAEDIIEHLEAVGFQILLFDAEETGLVERERRRCIDLCERWIKTFSGGDIQYTSPTDYATDAIRDIIDLISDGQELLAATPAQSSKGE